MRARERLVCTKGCFLAHAKMVHVMGASVGHSFDNRIIPGERRARKRISRFQGSATMTNERCVFLHQYKINPPARSGQRFFMYDRFALRYTEIIRRCEI